MYACARIHRLCFYLLVTLCFYPLFASGQNRPAEGAVLHYRMVGFSFPQVAKADSYVVEVATGHHANNVSFSYNIITRMVGGTNRIVAELPRFGQSYTWIVWAYIGGRRQPVGGLHHVATVTVPEVDSAAVRMRLIRPVAPGLDGWVFADGTHVLYNLAGQPIWYLPDLGGKILPGQDHVIRDLKTTPFGTITLLLDDHPYEISWDGEVLWQPPATAQISGDSTEYYHHEFTRLANGHYMVLGNELVLWDKTDTTHPIRAKEIASNNVGTHKRSPFGTVIEYDAQGKIVWSWKSSAYFTKSDVRWFVPPMQAGAGDVHLNGFWYDTSSKSIYLSFKNISRILQVSYPDGKVLGAWGEVYQPDVPAAGNGLFCGQHHCSITGSGRLMLFNNNSCHGADALPGVVVLQAGAGGKMDKMWEYTCNADGMGGNGQLQRMQQRREALKAQQQIPAMLERKQQQLSSGGSVQELDGDRLLVGMCNPYSKLLIVNKNKEELWTAVLERWMPAGNTWMTLLNYRAHYINAEQLHKLIWQGK